MQVEGHPLQPRAVPALQPRRPLQADVAEGSYVVAPDDDPGRRLAHAPNLPVRAGRGTRAGGGEIGSGHGGSGRRLPVALRAGHHGRVLRRPAAAGRERARHDRARRRRGRRADRALPRRRPAEGAPGAAPRVARHGVVDLPASLLAPGPRAPGGGDRAHGGAPAGTAPRPPVLHQDLCCLGWGSDPAPRAALGIETGCRRPEPGPPEPAAPALDARALAAPAGVEEATWWWSARAPAARRRRGCCAEAGLSVIVVLEGGPTTMPRPTPPIRSRRCRALPRRRADALRGPPGHPDCRWGAAWAAPR